MSFAKHCGWIVSSEIVPFCIILPGIPNCIVLGGSWSDLGCSVTLECSAFLLPRFPPLFHAIHWRLRLSFEFLCCINAYKKGVFSMEKELENTEMSCPSCGFYMSVTIDKIPRNFICPNCKVEFSIIAKISTAKETK